MPPRSRLSKHTSPMATEDLKLSEWERSKISNQDANLLKKLGFMKKENLLIFPGEESFPTPCIGYRATFVDHLIRGLSTPIHARFFLDTVCFKERAAHEIIVLKYMGERLTTELPVEPSASGENYSLLIMETAMAMKMAVVSMEMPSGGNCPSGGVTDETSLHQLTPNSILHISIFITLCECFLGTPPNWGLWKRIFLVRRNSSHNTAYNVGGVVICVRPDVEYFDVKFPDSVQGWRKRWLYIHEEHIDSQEYNVAPFDSSEKILQRRSWDAEATDEEKTATEALMKRIHELQNTRGKELSGI
ncbi:hypothetical protein QYE76_020588 [Lolium multiflorum]|uniref:Transposase (putative) gypsy type domain-containing protein n=1 Tax=Lolium multiflorum TaxID=4521 RepID=A0AAD8R6Q1_LOLMU|nr:hypothetical protein QYE76_020588 [Lolium multiflorum]